MVCSSSTGLFPGHKSAIYSGAKTIKAKQKNVWINSGDSDQSFWRTGNQTRSTCPVLPALDKKIWPDLHTVSQKLNRSLIDLHLLAE
ncbi:hypothetical protein PoB_007214100 [Plakobranchus ocellatus]|uniref:Uncharacterized protein n=1 Tax=Plakobranchus ocellatus TaxID=259542 RepID=A0AAV4DNC2_9GAST|nr:hypothetical protein PoB_007214100 [Plakobranchus ocellatus]